MYADADQQKRRQTQNYVHSRRADDCGEAIGETIAEINRESDDPRTGEGGRNSENVCAEMMGGVCSERDRGRDGAGADGERQSERIECAAKNVGRIHVLLDLAALVGIFLLEHGPAV